MPIATGDPSPGPRKPRRWFRDVWHDPVGSKVIAAGILVLVGWIGTLAVAHYDFDGGSALNNVARWARESVVRERGEFTFWLLLTFMAGLIVGVIAARRSAVGIARAHESPRPEPSLIKSTLEKADASVLKTFGLSPTPLSVNDLSLSLRKITRPRILLAIDHLKSLNMVVGAGMRNPNEAQFEPTPAGREYCHQKGWI